MRQHATRSAWMIAAALLLAGQATATARAGTAGPWPSVAATSCARPGCGASVRLAAAPGDRAGEPAAVPPNPGDAAAPQPPPRDDAGSALAPASPADAGAAPPPPQAPVRQRAAGAASIGHFRVHEHPPCDADSCRATVSDLDSHRSFEATVSLGPMHLASQLDVFARSGQIELLVSGELRRSPGGPALRALHLEGVTPHAPALPATPRAGHARPAPGAARSRPPAPPEPRLLRA